MADQGAKIWAFITEHTAAGRTVYAANYLQIIPITAKTVKNELVRLRNGHVEVCRGKRWDSLNYCKFTARGKR